MNELLSLSIIGFIATASMISFLWLITGLTRTSVDMIKALGSLYTNSLENALLPGLFMQFTGGLLMTYVYSIFLNLADFKAAYSFAFLALGIGFIHGISVSLVLKNLLAEHHPSEEYQALSKEATIAHIFAHLIYGLVIGTMYGVYLS